MNIDKLILKEQKKRKKTNTFSMDVLLEMIDEVLDAGADYIKPLLLMEGPTGKKSFTIDLIPMPQISEVGWGHLGDGNAAGPFRQELANYLKNIEGSPPNLKGKLAELNRFYAGEMAPELAGMSPSEQIQQVISYLVFYRVLTGIVVGFNAAAAGFAFESFMAILLDAQTGQQVPAFGAKTIADIMLYDGTRPISLKLYKHKSMMVGGSYKQLIEDLTGDNPVMEYILVTKEISGEKGDPMGATGKLHFYAFNFTLDNVIDILGEVSGATHKKVIELPKIFWDKDLTKKFMAGQARDDLSKFLTIPARTEINLQDYYDRFNREFAKTLEKVNFDDEEIETIKNNFHEHVLDTETGEFKYDQGRIKKPKVFYKSPKGGIFDEPRAIYFEEFINSLDVGLWEDPEQIAQNKELVTDALNSALKKYNTGYIRAAKKPGKSPQRLKREELKYQTPAKSLPRLRQLRSLDQDLYKFALQHTRGFTHQDKFELSEAALKKGFVPKVQKPEPELDATATGEDENITEASTFAAGKDTLFPYGTYEVNTIEIGRQNIQDVLDKSITELNESIMEIFGSLKSLSDNLNKYVADGLEEPMLAKAAQKDATEIDTKTGEVATGAQKPSAKYNFRRGNAPGSTGKRVPGGRKSEHKTREDIIE